MQAWKTMLELNGGAFTVELGRLERQVVRNALNLYKDQLEKSQKKDRELGVPNEATALMLAVIDGNNGWGEGLYAKMLEQRTLDEEEQAAAAEEAARAAEEALVRLRDEIALYADPPLALHVVRGWSDEERAAVAAAIARRAEGQDDEWPEFLVKAGKEAGDAREALMRRVAEFVSPMLPLHVGFRWTESESEEVAAWVSSEASRWAGETIDATIEAERREMPEFLAAAIREARGEVVTPDGEVLEEAGVGA